ncbi:40-kDa huntingtin-associated protein-like [Sminthopsis crassicaudata]|uniref:40-kDa huntingtin-associated protein-like n=1 Tax=Sminthopsis crassicaudata TaxID=9301 RepID=UPI003D6963AA
MTPARHRPMRASLAPRERVRAAAARSRGRGAMAVAGVGSLSSVVGGSGGVGGSGAGHDAGDFLARYRLVSNKLRKRFLRKPNVSEAGEQFGQLGKELRAQDCLPYAAWCQLAVARCHQTLFHGPGEALALTEAARLFLRQEREARLRLACAAAYGEPLQAAASCFAFAVRLHLELGQPAAAASLCLELAGALRALQQPGPAAVHFERAAELQLPLLPLEALLALGDAASCKLLTRDYDGALELFTRMQLLARERAAGGGGAAGPAGVGGGGGVPVVKSGGPGQPGAFLDVLVQCEVSRVLLLLLLQPPPPKLLPEHAQTLEKYCWEAFEGHCQDSICPLPEELFLLLQSLVMAAHEKDLDAMRVLQGELWPLLSADQNHLLHLILQEMVAPSGQGI